jgi:acyl-CoA synthetase (AMP-forming)/AMP-acid ligase II
MTPDQASPQSVYEAIQAAAQQWPDREFLHVLPETASVYGVEPGPVTYQGMLAWAKVLKSRYQDAGYRAGQHVFLLLENRPSFFAHWFAMNALGLVVVPVNPDLQSAELAYMAGHAEPVLAIAIEKRQVDLARAAKDAGVNYPVIGLDDPLPPAPQAAKPKASEPPGLKTPAAMLYTSGTTGAPKGCVLSNRYFLKLGEWYEGMGGACPLRRDGERMITPLPLFHMNAMACSTMAMIRVGGCLIALDRFHPSTWWDSVRVSGATCLHYLGVMPSILMKAEPGPKDSDHKCRFGFGAGVDPKLHAPFEERFGIPLIEGWAMTETGAGATLTNNIEPRKRGESCLGKPISGLEMRILRDDGTPSDVNEPGELLVRQAGTDPRDGFFSEYFKDEAATADAWQDGWFHTGDLVRRGLEGDFYFVDRKKNVIRRSGENIAAVEVESMLMQHPDIRAAGAAAVPDDIRGDEVFVCLVVDGERSEKRAKEIVQWALSRMAYYKVPGYIAFVDGLPLTGTQKIQRGELKKLAAGLVGAAGTFNTIAMKKRQGVS